jgi:hypothetical protein
VTVTRLTVSVTAPSASCAWSTDWIVTSRFVPPGRVSATSSREPGVRPSYRASRHSLLVPEAAGASSPLPARGYS